MTDIKLEMKNDKGEWVAVDLSRWPQIALMPAKMFRGTVRGESINGHPQLQQIPNKRRK